MRYCDLLCHIALIKFRVNVFSKETLRLYPAAGQTFRTVTKDNYDICGYTVPKGSDVAVSILAIHQYFQAGFEERIISLLDVSFYRIHIVQFQVSTYLVSRLPWYHKDPLTFDPERFHPDSDRR